MVSHKYKLSNAYVQEIYEGSYIVGSSTGENRYLLCLSENYEEKWKFGLSYFRKM